MPLPTPPEEFTISWLLKQPAEVQQAILSGLTTPEQAALRYHWRAWARPEQLEPPGAWSTWLILAGRGFGKALAIDTPIPTPTGWLAMGTIKAGDTVFDETGTQRKVLAAHPVMIGRECFRVRFSDGSEMVADGDHLWTTIDRLTRKAMGRARRPRRAPQTLTTREIAATLYDGREVNHCIPCTSPLQCPDRALPIDPYLLGCWLGNGSSSSAEITTPDKEIVAAFEAAGYVLRPIGARHHLRHRARRPRGSPLRDDG
jgi:hypothetical protein